MNRQQPGWDAFAEDIFGLSLRGLKSMRDLIVRPAAVLQAARTEDWGGKYTPSIRLVISLLTVMLLLRFFWAGDQSPNYQMIVATYEDIAAELPVDLTAEQMADQYFAYWALIFPVVYILLHALAASILRVWGGAAAYVLRSRLYFACLTPALVVSLFGLIAMPLVPVSVIWTYSFLSLLLAAVIYGRTYWRGMRNELHGGAKAWRAVLFAMTVFAVDLVVSIVTGIGAATAYRSIAPTGFVLGG